MVAVRLGEMHISSKINSTTGSDAANSCCRFTAVVVSSELI